jgi:uncharacterized protein (TIGR02001 family)
LGLAGAGGFVGPVVAADATPKASEDGAANTLKFGADAGIASDYVYRGVTLSDRKPSLDASVEATFSLFYGKVSIASVRLPTQPAAEVTFEGGIRKTIADIDFELSVSYFSYPGETLPSNGINYWEASVSAEKSFDAITLSAEYAYSPNFSNTGAWGHYVEAGISFDLPKKLLPADFGVALSGALGYSWFGNQSDALGGFPLPAYLNWNAGLIFSYNIFKLDLRYYDTSLSREDCFVFTGDPNAQPGGRIDAITNPGGLTSRWCGTAFVGKLSFELEPR